jgi:hypothetical protein
MTFLAYESKNCETSLRSGAVIVAWFEVTGDAPIGGQQCVGSASGHVNSNRRCRAVDSPWGSCR